MHKAKFNKDVAGYLMLLLLAEVDGDFDPREGTVIVDFIKETFPFGSNLESAAEEIGMLKIADYGVEITNLAEDFYTESTEDERTAFLRFAIKLISADEKIDIEEDRLINRLFAAWDI